MLEAEENAQWDDLVLQSNIINKNFPDTPFADEAQYFLAVGYFHLGELETANRQFSSYLKQPSAPKYFEEAIRFKFEIAQKFEQGSRTHILGLSALPKWMPAKEIAIDIYDEVITALPHHELTVQSLFGKACLQLALKEYSTSIETYQLIIRKFSKHPLASESYVGIAKVYLEQCQNEYPDPDFLDLAEINYKKYKSEFSLEPKLEVAHEMLSKMREIYAGTLYETAQFYERTKKPQASAIYYNKILAKYPKTDVAHMSDQRLVYLESKLNRPLRDAPLLEDHEGQVVISSEPEQEATELVDQKE
jgi:tetratricopeptide (TPR) repeat protein